MNDQDRIQGAWEVTQVIGLADEDAEDARRTGYWFCGERLITGDTEAAWEWPFKLNDSTIPHQLVTWPEDERFPYSPKALYKFESEELLLCYNPLVNDFPRLFEASAETGDVILRLVRSTRPIPE